MFFEVFLTPNGIIIEADDEKDFNSKIKNIPMQSFIFDHKKITKEEVEKELKKRHIFINLNKPKPFRMLK